jgi:hypothetical protein
MAKMLTASPLKCESSDIAAIAGLGRFWLLTRAALADSLALGYLLSGFQPCG